MKRIISTKDAPSAIGPYSQGIQVGSLLFVSGQLPIDPTSGQIVEGGVKSQVHQCLKNLQGIIEAAGSGLKDVVKTTVFLKDMNEFAQMNEVYGQFFSDYPSRSAVEVSRLPKDAQVEVEAIVYLG